MMFSPFVAAVACLYVSVDCAGKAVGSERQFIFSDRARWLWWPISIAWFASALRFILGAA